MKIKLLNDGGYDSMGDVNFPVIVEGEGWEGLGFDVLGFDVLGSELITIGADAKYIINDEEYYFSLLEGECEVIEE
ncbi:hypothetical protein [Proteus mirabilis]|uniref:hypothetical protein n=1 Tax=Proteus mirabilis TaxID=584 RepID=UPI0035587B8E